MFEKTALEGMWKIVRKWGVCEECGGGGDVGICEEYGDVWGWW